MNKKIIIIITIVVVVLIAVIAFKANHPSQPLIETESQQTPVSIQQTESQSLPAEQTPEQTQTQDSEQTSEITPTAPTENVDDTANDLLQEITDEQSIMEGEENDAISNEADQAISDFGQSYGEDEF